ncbi:MAG: hypothetical protein ACTSUB_10380 [Candidatus Thorarchaeota archaeon]
MQKCVEPPGGTVMASESADDMVFKEYRELGSESRSLEQYFVAVTHLTAAVLISLIQFNYGLSAWLLGFGIVVPILLIIHGFVYLFFRSESWFREQMLPFILSIIMATEIETDRYLQYHRRFRRLMLILGWPGILICQAFWTFGLTGIMPIFSGDDFVTRLVGELVAYCIFLGPFFLYGLVLLFLLSNLERLLKPGYQDIVHLFDVENKWNKEHHRRAQDPGSVNNEDAPTDNRSF